MNKNGKRTIWNRLMRLFIVLIVLIFIFYSTSYVN